MRKAGWEKRLRETVEKHMASESEYGVSDCLIIALDAIEAVTGEDPYPPSKFDRVYSDERGALRCLVKAGFKSVDEVLAAKFSEIPTSMAQRGDVGVVDIDGMIAAGVFTQLGFMSRGKSKVVFLPASQVKTAYKVS